MFGVRYGQSVICLEYDMLYQFLHLAVHSNIGEAISNKFLQVYFWADYFSQSFHYFNFLTVIIEINKHLNINILCEITSRQAKVPLYNIMVVTFQTLGALIQEKLLFRKLVEDHTYVSPASLFSSVSSEQASRRNICIILNQFSE